MHGCSSGAHPGSSQTPAGIPEPGQPQDDDLADGLIKQSETFDDDQLDFIRDIFGNLITDTKNGYLKNKVKGVAHPLQEEELAIINVCQKQLGADEFESVEQFYRNKSNTWNEIIEEKDDKQD